MAQRKIEAVISQVKDPHQQNKLWELYEACAPGRCLLEKTGSCGGCALAQLTVGLVRWAMLKPEVAMQLVQPLCSEMMSARNPRMNIAHLQNTDAHSGFGGGVSGSRRENWQR